MATNLIELLESEDEETRHQAFDEIGLSIDDALAEQILRLATGGASPEVRADAVIVLGPAVEESGWEYDDEPVDEAPENAPVSREMYERILAGLRALYEDDAQPTLVRRRALEVLVRAPQPWHRDEIARRFASDDRDWKLTAVFGMGYMPGFEDELARLLHSTEGDLLEEAIHAARMQEAPGTAERLTELAASDGTPREIRLAAIAALPSVSDDADELLEELARSDDDEIAETAEEALDEIQALRSGRNAAGEWEES